MAPAPALQTHHLTKRFGKRVTALDGLDLSVEPGQVYGFLGKNGAGKTTTIRILLDLIRPSGGSVALFGIDPRRDRSVLRRVGALVETAAFYPFLTARGNLELLAQMVGAPLDSIDALLERVGLTAYANARFRTFSTGLAQWLGIAAALLGDPPLLILDEPTTGLDPVGVIQLRHLIHDLAAQEGKTIFLSSHQLGEVEQTCDRVAIMDRGRLVREGTLSDLLGRPVIRLVVGSAEAAQAALIGAWPGLTVVDSTRLELAASREQVPQIVARLVAAQVSVFEVQPASATLEALFLSLVDEAHADVQPLPR